MYKIVCIGYLILALGCPLKLFSQVEGRILIVAGLENRASCVRLSELINQSGNAISSIYGEEKRSRTAENPDLLIVCATPEQMTYKDSLKITQWIATGIPIVLLREGLAWLGPDGYALSGVGSLAVGPFGPGTNIKAIPGYEAHPIVAELPSRFYMSSWQWIAKPLDSLCSPLLLGEALEGVQVSGQCFTLPEVAAWTRVRPLPGGRTQRIFCSTLGESADFAQKAFMELLVQAIKWGWGE